MIQFVVRVKMIVNLIWKSSALLKSGMMSVSGLVKKSTEHQYRPYQNTEFSILVFQVHCGYSITVLGYFKSLISCIRNTNEYLYIRCCQH